MESSKTPISFKSNSTYNFDNKASPEPSLVQPSPLQPAELNSERINAVEDQIQRFVPFFNPSTKRNFFLGATLGVSGSLSAASGNSTSAGNIGATSNAFVEISAHLQTILVETEVTSPNELSFQKYKENVELVRNHRFENDELKKYEAPPEHLQMIKLAASASADAYKDGSVFSTVQEFGISHNKKAMIVFTEDIGRQRMLVVAVRGTVTKEDWMLNFNSHPALAPDLLDRRATWHGGFLTVAKAMEKQTATAISEALSTAREDIQRIDGILFTGHSAGGAIAQLFYAMSFSKQSRISRAVSPHSLTAHCITFGAPPIASLPLHLIAPFKDQKEIFLSIVNEGDPVPQAQEEFIKVLIEMFISARSVIKQRYKSGIEIPRGHFRASGNTIIFRDDDPDGEVSDDEDGIDFGAYRVDSEILETKLFGNPFVHSMIEYVSRVDLLVSRCSVRHVVS